MSCGFTRSSRSAGSARKSSAFSIAMSGPVCTGSLPTMIAIIPELPAHRLVEERTCRARDGPIPGDSVKREVFAQHRRTRCPVRGGSRLLSPGGPVGGHSRGAEGAAGGPGDAFRPGGPALLPGDLGAAAGSRAPAQDAGRRPWRVPRPAGSSRDPAGPGGAGRRALGVRLPVRRLQAARGRRGSRAGNAGSRDRRRPLNRYVTRGPAARGPWRRATTSTRSTSRPRGSATCAAPCA